MKLTLDEINEALIGMLGVRPEETPEETVARLKLQDRYLQYVMESVADGDLFRILEALRLDASLNKMLAPVENETLKEWSIRYNQFVQEVFQNSNDSAMCQLYEDVLENETTHS